MSPQRKDVADVLLLLRSDLIDQRVAQRVGAVDALEVVVQRGDPGRTLSAPNVACGLTVVVRAIGVR